MQAIHTLLGLTRENYREIIFQHYSDWCVTHARNSRDYQMLLADTGLSNWFITQYRYLEQAFLQEYRPYRDKGRVGTEDAMPLYTKNVIRIKQCYYCLPLLTAARKKKIENDVNTR